MDRRTSVALLQVKSLCTFIPVLPENSVVCHCREAISDQIQEQPLCLYSLIFFPALSWQLQIWLSSGQLQLGRVDLQCVIYTGIFQREAEQIGKKYPNKTIHASLQVKETSLYFKLIS